MKEKQRGYRQKCTGKKEGTLPETEQEMYQGTRQKICKKGRKKLGKKVRKKSSKKQGKKQAKKVEINQARKYARKVARNTARRYAKQQGTTQECIKQVESR